MSNQAKQKKLFNDKHSYSDKEFPNHSSWAKAVKERDDYQCQYGIKDKYHKHNGKLEAHHLFPKKYGGKNIISNGITLCKDCHAPFLIEAEQKFYSKTLDRFAKEIFDFIRGLIGMPKQLRYFTLLDYLTDSKSFREKQLESIKTVVENNKNLIFVSPTASGKSLIYQMAGILNQTQSLVISPLLALQKNQVESLWRKRVPSTLINSTIVGEEKKKRLLNIFNKGYSFVFAHPKQFLDKNKKTNKIEIKIRNILTQAEFGMLCVDEAHVINRWRQSFIEEYGELLKLRKYLKVSNTILLSASLNKKMQDELSDSLFNEDEKPEVIVTGFYRPEIELIVEKIDTFNLDYEYLNKRELLLKILNENKNEKIIIFTITPKEVDELVLFLNAKGFNAEGFHSKLNTDKKQIIQDRFNETFSGMTDNKIDILVCTSAFGMGVNIPNIHVSIHYFLPFNLIDYYQQFGRIGRDGKKSKAYLLYDPHEESNSITVYIKNKQIENESDEKKRQELMDINFQDEKDFVNYIEAEDKWKYILDYFGSNEDDSQIDSTVVILVLILMILIFLSLIA